jgi:L-alanine-DL-glutamate epimerase-like enolase superfamily enzyme
MKIIQLTCYSAKGLLYIKLDTDEGISGFGECSPMQIETTLQLIQNVVKPEVLGMSPFDGELIEERIMTKHYKISGQLLAMAYSGVEIACWDIKAKAAKQPMYNMLGGKYRQAVPLYGSSMSRDLTYQQEAAKLREGIDKFQFKAVKIWT